MRCRAPGGIQGKGVEFAFTPSPTNVLVYGGYVVMSIVAFAFLSILNARELAERSGLARGVCCYIAVFWGVRVVLQGVFDVKEHLSAWWLKAGYFMLTVLFAALTVLYAWAAVGVVR